MSVMDGLNFLRQELNSLCISILDDNKGAKALSDNPLCSYINNSLRYAVHRLFLLATLISISKNHHDTITPC